jgi:hypothetical protein
MFSVLAGEAHGLAFVSLREQSIKLRLNPLDSIVSNWGCYLY